MALISNILDQAARDLNDFEKGHEFTAWSKDQLRTYLSEALQLSFRARSDLFMEVVNLELQTCTTFQNICDCDSLTYDSVLGQSTIDGRVIKPLKPRIADATLQWRGKACPPGKPFQLREYSITPDGKGLQVFPLIPPNEQIYLAVRCAVRPFDFSDDVEVSEELVAPIIQWVLYRAKMVDGENNPVIVNVAAQHEATFWNLLNAKFPGKPK